MVRICVLILGTITSFAAASHHSRGHFDGERIVELEGEVASVFWRNPHVELTLRTVTDGGEEQIWEIESDSVNNLIRRGITESVVNVGDRVTIAGTPSLRNEQHLLLVHVGLPGGETVVMMPSQARRVGLEVDGVGSQDAPLDESAVDAAIRQAQGIFRVWSLDRYGGGNSPTLTEAASAAVAAWNQERDDPTLRCEPPGMPSIMPNPYPMEFLAQGDDIILRLEEWDSTRTIHMGDPENPATLPPSLMGYSAGHWEGDTLVVETSRISYPFHDVNGTPQSEDAVIVERFTLSEDDTQLEWEATITDPANFLGPAILRMAWQWVPGEEIKPYRCALPETEPA